MASAKKKDGAPPVEVHDLTVSYGSKPVLWDVDVAFPEGQLIAIVGPNGAGKSTLLKSMLSLVPVASGWVQIFGHSPKKARHLIGYVPQRESVDWDFPTNALDVVLMGRYGHLGWIKRPGKHDKRVAKRCLEQVGIPELALRQISQLSGGQQQRVFLARALAQEADLYFMDEPFAGVDATTEKAIVTLLRTLRKEGKTVICVHHDLQTLADYFDWVALLNMRLVAAGPIKEVFTTENLHRTYGGTLSVLTQATERLLQKQIGKE